MNKNENNSSMAIIVIIIIVGWWFYNNYTSNQRYDKERAYCVSSATTDGWGHTASYCYGLSNSDLDSMYKIGQ
jgi:hypothetical protein